MSLRLRILNAWLRLVEKPAMRRATEPAALRRSFERKARIFFHAPRGTRFETRELAGVSCRVAIPRSHRPGRTLLYLHGGGYIFGSARTHSAMAAALAARISAIAILPDYRLAPEHPHPAAIQDATAVLDHLGPGCVLGGDSAGGGLALALLARQLGRGAALPAATFAFSPLTDLNYDSESLTRNAASEAVLPADRAPDIAAMFLAGQSADDPTASPLFAEFEGSPPVWLTVGDREILLDDTCRIADRLRKQGVDVTKVVKPDHPHVWPIFHNTLPEARETMDELATWIRARAGWPAGS